MADRKAINKYYPPDWDPSKGSINTYVGQHPLRERARKLDQGILIVRFELPYNIWCDGCNSPIGKGVRYNAEKKKVGKYYSTPILSFRMKCHLCDNWFEIQTDPKNTEYVITSGAKRKTETFDAADNETIELDTREEFEKRIHDQFSKLEHIQNDERKAKTGATVLTRLQRLNNRQWGDPYAISQRLRKGFRDDKKARQKVEAECQAIADRIGFAFDILPESESDRRGSRGIDFVDEKKDQLAQKLKEVRAEGLFTSKSKRGTSLAISKQGAKTSSLNSSDKVLQALSSTVAANTRLQTDPFSIGSKPKSTIAVPKTSIIAETPKPPTKLPLVNYGADEDDSD
ncbi:hypothetical protein BGW38_009689 [Lunasporangiospora selenospora]|uniref:DUF572-domain-containing protein n=1 Tax=Lunasporangiospora selenospora TaxID=979761 RepID=A0A9P6FWV5_9FUNG|nr:hypothetical protein BGW38_009689 [Lunasporangiospora selenospora]